MTIQFLFYTGMRNGKLFALTKKDIGLNKGIININKSYQKLAKIISSLHQRLLVQEKLTCFNF
jgi:integrase